MLVLTRMYGRFLKQIGVIVEQHVQKCSKYSESHVQMFEIFCMTWDYMGPQIFFAIFDFIRTSIFQFSGLPCGIVSVVTRYSSSQRETVWRVQNVFEWDACSVHCACGISNDVVRKNSRSSFGYDRMCLSVNVRQSWVQHVFSLLWGSRVGQLPTKRRAHLLPAS